MRPGGVQVMFDCADPQALGVFWAAVLGYLPPDADVWHEKLRKVGLPEGELDNFRQIQDPEHVRPTLAFQRVPEAKTVKNRVHLDIRAPRRESREAREQIDDEVARIEALGGRQVRPVTDEVGYFVVMQDPEGNEFCID